LKLSLRLFARTYPWRRVDPIPGASLAKKVSDARVALVSTTGLVAPGDPPFDRRIRGGDYSYRVVPADADVQALEKHHRSDAFDHSGIEADRNLGMPLDRLRELARNGEIGELAPRHISLMGSITAPGRLVKHTVPAVVDLLVEDRVDLALLVPG
jgi:D-proline reductase (dithiol) PrdB